jgi:hypothetical protein
MDTSPVSVSISEAYSTFGAQGKNGTHPLRLPAVCAGEVKWLRLTVMNRHGSSADRHEKE